MRPGAVPPRTAWPTKNAVKLATSVVRSTTPANTATFPHNIGSRRGTTVNEERIIPVLYSPLISRTPSTPIANCAKKMPVSDIETEDSPGPRPPGWFAVIAVNRAPRPIMKTTAISNV